MRLFANFSIWKHFSEVGPGAYPHVPDILDLRHLIVSISKKLEVRGRKKQIYILCVFFQEQVQAYGMQYQFLYKTCPCRPPPKKRLKMKLDAILTSILKQYDDYLDITDINTAVKNVQSLKFAFFFYPSHRSMIPIICFSFHTM